MKHTVIVQIALFIMLTGCATDRSVTLLEHMVNKHSGLQPLARELAREDNIEKQVELRRKIYRLGKSGIEFLVEGVADMEWHRKIVVSSSSSNDFCIHMRNGPRYYFVDVQGGETSDLSDLTQAMNERLIGDDDYLNRFITARTPSGIYMEECIDELTDDASTPASRRIAHRYLQDHVRLKLSYDPTSPVSTLPQDVRTQLAKWKRDHYEGSFWQEEDRINANFNVEGL